MSKKSLVLILVSLCGLFTETITDCSAETGAGFEQAKQSINSFIDAGDYVNAELATTKLATDFSSEPNLSEAIYKVAEKYESSVRFEETKRIYQQVIRNYTGSSWANKARLGVSRAEVLSLIDSEKFDQAKVTLDKLVVDFNTHQDLPETLYWIAEKYKWPNKYEETNRIHQQIIQMAPNSPWAGKAKLGISRAEVLSLVNSGKLEQAKGAFDKLIVDFNAQQPDLPETLYLIGEKFEWAYGFDEAKSIYQLAIQKYPNNPWTRKAKLGISRAQVMFLIDSQKYDQAKKAFEKMITDFSGDPNLPATVYWIAEKYKWSDRPEESSRICGMIIQKYPDTYWAGRAMLGVSRVDAMSLSTSKNYQEAQNAIDKLAVDYAENPDLPQTIYWIAEKYKWSFNFTEANRVYQQVIQKYPDSVWAENAKLGIATSDVLSLVITGEYERAQASLDKLVVDYAKHPNLPRLIMVVGEQYYKEGLAKDSNGFAAEAKPLFERAVKVWDGLLTTYPNSNVEAEICCWAGDCFYKLGRYEESLQRFLKVVDNYPKYDYVWHAQFMVGYNYEGLKKSGVISKEQADPMIRAAYTELLEKYPTCNAATIAQDWINQNNSK